MLPILLLCSRHPYRCMSFRIRGEKEKQDYFAFLKSGGSRYPIESLRVAGVDMESAEPIQAALDTFKSIVEQLEKKCNF